MPKVNDPRQWFTDEQDRELVSLEGNGVIQFATAADIEPKSVVIPTPKSFLADALPALPVENKRQDRRIAHWELKRIEYLTGI